MTKPHRRTFSRVSRDAVAALLDRTHAVGARGPRTLLARKRLAAVLDLGFTPRRADIAWLTRVARLQEPQP